MSLPHVGAPSMTPRRAPNESQSWLEREADRLGACADRTRALADRLAECWTEADALSNEAPCRLDCVLSETKAGLEQRIGALRAEADRIAAEAAEMEARAA